MKEYAYSVPGKKNNQGSWQRKAVVGKHRQKWLDTRVSLQAHMQTKPMIPSLKQKVGEYRGVILFNFRTQEISN